MWWKDKRLRGEEQEEEGGRAWKEVKTGATHTHTHRTCRDDPQGHWLRSRL